MGVPNTATYGQTITATATQARLSSFTFQLISRAAWCRSIRLSCINGTRRTSGFRKRTFLIRCPHGTVGRGFTPVTINTGSVVLKPGQQYVLFLTTSTITGQATGKYVYGAPPNNAAYGGGQFVYLNHANFSQLTTSSWNTHLLQDLAFQAVISAVNVGDNHAQAQSGAFQLGNSYLSLLTDPFATNKVSTATGPLGYAAEKKLPEAVRAANAAFKACRGRRLSAALGRLGRGLRRRQQHAGRYRSGHLRSLHARWRRRCRRRLSSHTLIGFSLAGGNINWSVNSAATTGSGSSDTFMAGVYGKYGFGAGYLSGAATYTNYWMRTDVQLPSAGDLFRANFEAESWGGRLEGGYRAGQYWAINWTPYGAIQGQSFRTPNYAETVELGPRRAR